MTEKSTQPPLGALEVAPRTKRSLYPEPFASRMERRTKRVLGDLFGLSNFGVNMTTLQPGGSSALRHAHSRQDEFIYVVAGHLTLLDDNGRTPLAPGMCAGFKAGSGNAHCLVNESGAEAIYLEVGDRSADDEVSYPDDDLVARFVEGGWKFFHKDGTPW